MSLVFLECEICCKRSCNCSGMLWDHRVHPEPLGFIHYAQSPVIGMQRSQTLREPHWDVCSPCCVHAHSRLEHNGFSQCWGHKHGYLCRDSLLEEARFFAGLSRKHYKPVPLSPVPLFFIVSNRLTWFFSNRAGITGAHCSEFKSCMSTPYGTMEEKRNNKNEWFLCPDRWLQFATMRSPWGRLSTVLQRAVAEGGCSQSSSQQWCLWDSMVSLCSVNHFEIAA